MYACAGQEPSTSKQEDLIYGERWYRRKRLPAANQVLILRDRELGQGRRNPRHFRNDRDFYPTLPLERVVQTTEMLGPRDHILGWTPDGLRLIALSFHLDAVRIYNYLGAQSANSVKDDRVLEEMFKLQSEIKVRPTDVQFRFECVLFTDDAKHLIIPASGAVSDSQIHLDQVHRTNESMPLVSNSIEDYFFFCIDVAEGKQVGELSFMSDRILLPHGVHISKRYLLITSYQHQTMNLVFIHPQTGMLIPVREIGPSVMEDENLHLPVSPQTHRYTSFHSGLKQRIMTFLYNRAKEEKKVPEFLRSFEYYSMLRIDKAHIFEEFFLLIRMLPRDMGRESSALPCFFVIMDWREASVLEIYQQFDDRFFKCVTELSSSLLFPITTEAWVGADLFSTHARLALARGKKRGDVKHSPETLRRLLNQLPFPSYQPYKISAQSPYLDPYLFHLDDKVAAGILNGKVRMESDDPRFMSSRSGRVAFQLPVSSITTGTLRQVSLLFHPRDPLCLASDRLRQDASVILFLPRSEAFEGLVTIKSPERFVFI